MQIGWHAVIAGWIAQPLALLALGQLPPLFQPAPAADLPALDATGALLGAAGLAGTLWCHRALGSAWRLWISERAPALLVESGPYRWVRHPIYTFQLVCMAGSWMLIPTPFLGGVFLLHLFCVGKKAAAEERHLLGHLGESYRNYLDRTGRFLPRLRTPA